LYGTLATAVPFHNISTLCNRNKKQTYHFSESSKSRMRLASRSLATPAI